MKSLAHLTDCPRCKYGTVDRKPWTDHNNNPPTVGYRYRCADCQFIWSEPEWNRLLAAKALSGNPNAK